MFFISHRLNEIVAVCDRVVVLRDGRMVGTLDKGQINHDAMVKLMVGRDLRVAYTPPKRRKGRCRARGQERAHLDLSASRGIAGTPFR